MYQLLIVDDEKEIRGGLASWNWEKVGVQVAGCCANGVEALLFLSEHPVDIVMTDIRMPFMDGIELMEILNRQYEFIQVLILSGYSEFEYARRAIQLGAVNYLLKPIQFEEMYEAIRALTVQMDENKQAEQRMAVLTRKTEQLSRVLRNRFLSQIFEGSLSDEELGESSAEGEVLLDDETYQGGVIRMDRFTPDQIAPSPQELKLVVFSLDDVLDRVWDANRCGYHIVNPKTAEASLLIKGSTDPERLDELMHQLLKFKGIYKSTFTISVGPVVHSPTEIHKSLCAARARLPQLAHNVVDILNQWPSDWDQESRGNLGETKATESVLVPVTDDHPGSVALVGAKRYIRNNYLRSLTLKEVAEQVYVSPNYLSALFKAHNETFLKYLTAVRINKARELLSDPRYKIYKVAELVGYSDPSYFWEVFKKQTGQTPREFRSRILRSEDPESV